MISNFPQNLAGERSVKIKTFPLILCLLAFFLSALACARETGNRSFSHAEFRFCFPFKPLLWKDLKLTLTLS